MPLSLCRRLWGLAKFIPDDPAVDIYRNTFLIGGAVYNSKRRLISESGLYTGIPHLRPVPSREMQSFLTDFDPAYIRDELPDRQYYWGGFLYDHYGHFLVGTLPRLWAYPSLPNPRPKILCWGTPIDAIFQLEFSKTIFEHLGIRKEDFYFVDGSVRARVNLLIVAETSLEENHFVHDIYGRFMRELGHSITPDALVNKDDRPVFISKGRLTKGTARTINEDELTDRLERGGVEIIYPEWLTLSDQIRVWRGREVIAGFLGSALLTAAFGESRKLVVLNHEAQVYSNQVLIDKVSNNYSSYYYPYEGIVNDGSNDDFQFRFRYLHPIQTAEELLRAIELARTKCTSRREISADTLSHVAYVDSPIDSNITHLCYNEEVTSIGLTATHASRVLAIRLILPSLYSIDELRIFFGVGVRTSLIWLCLYFDAQTLLDLPCDVGGMPTDQPFRWQPDQPVHLRVIEVYTQGGTQDCPLNVEVFGCAIE